MKTLLPIPNFFAETLREAIEESGRSQEKIAKATGIPGPHLSEMKNGRRRCTPEHDLRLSRYFRMTPGLWTRLQLEYEFRTAEREKGASIRKEVKPLPAAAV